MATSENTVSGKKGTHIFEMEYRSMLLPIFLITGILLLLKRAKCNIA